MLSPEELKLFLEMLNKFLSDTGMSRRMTSQLLNVSNTSFSRWLTDDEAQKRGVLRYVADNVTKRIKKLNAVNEEHELYRRLESLRGNEKLLLLQDTLNDKVTW